MPKVPTKTRPTTKPPSPAKARSAEKMAPAAKGKSVPARRRGKRLAAATQRAPQIFDRLQDAYPDAHCALDHRSPFELIVATILSAQCTDKRVNMVTPALFARFPDAHAMALANPEELEGMIKSTGFFRAKTKSLIGMSTAVVEKHTGDVPDTMEALVQLPGVGRKTANVVLGNAFGRDEGIVVDTHVTRLSLRLGLTTHTDAVKIESDLIPLFPRDRWTMLAHLLIEHGRQICVARTPKCEQCVLNDLCPSSRV